MGLYFPPKPIGLEDLSRHDLDEWDLVDATWSIPGSSVELRSELSHTYGVLDTVALKAIPPDQRIGSEAISLFEECGAEAGSVLFYDRIGFFSAPWAAWLARANGIDCAVGYGWGAVGEMCERDTVEYFVVTPNRDTLADKVDVLEAIDGSTQIVDVRSPGRYSGREPEPRPGCRSGHIPGSVNLHYRDIRKDDGLKSRAKLQVAFAEAGIDLSRPIITTCGSGVTASMVALAAEQAGAKPGSVRVYQGSWAEWGSDDTLPIEIGA